MAQKTLKILSGKPTVEYHEKLIRERRVELEKKEGRAPELSLATIQVGDSLDVQLYAKHLSKILVRFGIRHIEKTFPAQTPSDRLLKEVGQIYQDPTLTGTLIFSPLPPNAPTVNLFIDMPVTKDVEGRTFLKRNPFGVFSPTAKASMALLRHLERHPENKFSITGKHAVMVGHSDLVGKPTALLLSDAGATVTVCHKDTKNIKKYVGDADILVVAVGKPNLIPGGWIKRGSVVIDVGENVVDGKVVGDVNFDEAIKRAAFISPVPGGVGPLTNLMLIENLLTLHEFKGRLNGLH